jgi:hypothetical protein
VSSDLASDGVIFIGNLEIGTVFYWLSVDDEQSTVVAEGCITGTEDLMQRVENSEQVRLQLDDGPTFALVTDGGANGSRWVRLFAL